MKVLIINPILYTSETDAIPKVSSIKDTMIYSLCMGFIKNGDVPVLVAAESYRPLKQERYPFPVLWFPCLFPKVCKPRCIPLLKGLGSYLREHGSEYDYMISSEAFSLHTLQGALYAGKKLVIWHELGAHNHMMRKVPSLLWYNFVVRLFMGKIPIIPRSDEAAEFIGRYSSNVLPVRIDHGVDLDKTGYSRKKENYFVVLSQLVERKRIDRILVRFSAFCRRNREKKYQLKIIGEGPLRQKLEQQARELGEEENILFLGKQSHESLMPVLGRAKALLVNTAKDNSMVSIVESIAAGTPVITTPVPFNASYIREFDLGIVESEWGVDELNEICVHNERYVDNCIRYRDRLGNGYLAGQFNQVGGRLFQ